MPDAGLVILRKSSMMMKMNIVEYEQMATMEKFYWWHVGRNRIITDQLKKITKAKKRVKILNIGCGTGGTIPLLKKFGKVTNVDNSPEVAKYLKRNGIKDVVLVDSLKLPFQDNEFDIVVGFDVLEHIKQEDTALKEWRRVIKPDGHLFLTVPAYQWLWSEHDIGLHHFRRYTTKRLKQRVTKNGFQPKKVSYAIAFSLPMIVTFRYAKKGLQALKPGKSEAKQHSEISSYIKVPDSVNKLFSRILFLESRALKHVNFPFGTTVLTVARNKERAPRS